MFEMERTISEDVRLSTPAFSDVKLSTPADAEICTREEIPSQVVSANEISEIAPSAEIQATMIREEFLSIREVQYDTWKELTVEERVAAMNALEKQVAMIAHRDPITVQCEALEYPLMGYYNNQKRIMVISEASVGDDSYESYVRALETLFHEGRHAYQDYNLDVRLVEQSEELVKAWSVNRDGLGYDSGDRLIFKTHGMQRYYTQPVEVDARIFSETVIKELGL